MAIRTIVADEPIRRDEAIANAAITPGMLIELMSTGKVRAHATAGGSAVLMVAFESENEGEDVTDAYAANDQVLFGYFAAGQRVNVLLADGETAVKNSFLESNGDGYFRVVDADASWDTIVPNSVKLRADAALDFSGSAGVDPSSALLQCTAV